MIIRPKAQVIAVSSVSRRFMTLSPDMPMLFGNQFEESAYSAAVADHGVPGPDHKSAIDMARQIIRRGCRDHAHLAA
jgi:hypothetical protein